MSIQVALLKSGESVIADIQEIVFEEKSVGYFFNKPCLVNFVRNDSGQSYDIGLFPWIPITKTLRVPVPFDWVVTLVDPIDQLDSMYRKDVLKEENDQDNSADE